jgi:hypothetical protein
MSASFEISMMLIIKNYSYGVCRNGVNLMILMQEAGVLLVVCGGL